MQWARLEPWTSRSGVRGVNYLVTHASTMNPYNFVVIRISFQFHNSDFLLFHLKQEFFFLHLFLQIDNSFGQIKPFTFNAAFGEETTQKEMFNECGIKHLVEMAVEGFVNNDQAISSFKTGLQKNLNFFF